MFGKLFWALGQQFHRDLSLILLPVLSLCIFYHHMTETDIVSSLLLIFFFASLSFISPYLKLYLAHKGHVKWLFGCWVSWISTQFLCVLPLEEWGCLLAKMCWNLFNQNYFHILWKVIFMGIKHLKPENEPRSREPNAKWVSQNRLSGIWNKNCVVEARNKHQGIRREKTSYLWLVCGLNCFDNVSSLVFPVKVVLKSYCTAFLGPILPWKWNAKCELQVWRLKKGSLTWGIPEEQWFIVHLGCHSKTSQIWWFEQQKFIFSVLEVETPSSRCSGLIRGESFSWTRLSPY